MVLKATCRRVAGAGAGQVGRQWVNVPPAVRAGGAASEACGVRGPRTFSGLSWVVDAEIAMDDSRMLLATLAYTSSGTWAPSAAHKLSGSRKLDRSVMSVTSMEPTMPVMPDAMPISRSARAKCSAPQLQAHRPALKRLLGVQR